MSPKMFPYKLTIVDVSATITKRFIEAKVDPKNWLIERFHEDIFQFPFDEYMAANKFKKKNKDAKSSDPFIKYSPLRNSNLSIEERVIIEDGLIKNVMFHSRSADDGIKKAFEKLKDIYSGFEMKEE